MDINKKKFNNSKIRNSIFCFLFSIFSVVILSSIFFFLNSRPAYAEVPVKCDKCSKENTLKEFSKKETENTRNVYTEQLKEFDFMRNKEILKRNLFNFILNKIQDWILGKSGSGNCTISGINGPIIVPCNQTNQPKFVTNWKEYMANAYAQGGNGFLNTLSSGIFCPSRGGIDTTPFIQNLLRQQFDSSFSVQYSCGVPNNQTNVFALGGGGWNAWLKLNEPGNDFFSNYLLTYDETLKRAEFEQEAKIREADQGFLPEKECKETTTKIITNPDGTEKREEICIREEIKTPALIVSQYAKENVDSTYDNINNADDLTPYLSILSGDLFNLIMNLGFKNIPSGAVGSVTQPSGNGGESFAERACASFRGKPAFQDCARAVQSGQDITKFAKQYLLGLIDDELKFLNAIKETKQQTANTLAQSVDVLNQTNSCQASVDQNPKKTAYLAANPGAATQFTDPISLNNAVTARNAVVKEIIDLQKRIDELNKLRSDTDKMTDKDEIANALAAYRPTLGPGEGQSNLEGEQEKLSTAQQNLIIHQDKLINCQNLKAAIEAFSTPLQ